MIKIIKARETPTRQNLRRDENAGFVDVADEVDACLEHARQQAADIVTRARDEAESIRQRAAGLGKQDAAQLAHSQMLQEVEAQLATALPALDHAVRSLQQEKAGHLHECERHVVRLAVAIAEKLVRSELTRHPQIPLHLVREALDLASGSRRIKLHLNPLDYQTLGTSIDHLLSGFSEDVRADVVADPKVTRGGCLVQTEFGSIDQQFETQLARIQEELT